MSTEDLCNVTNKADNVGLLHSTWEIDAKPVQEPLAEWQHNLRRIGNCMAMFQGRVVEGKLRVHHQRAGEMVLSQFLIAISEHFLRRGSILYSAWDHVEIRVHYCIHDLLLLLQIQIRISPLLFATRVAARPRSVCGLAIRGHKGHLPRHEIQHSCILALRAPHAPRVVWAHTSGTATLKKPRGRHELPTFHCRLPQIKRRDVRERQHFHLLDGPNGTILDRVLVHRAQAIGLTSMGDLAAQLVKRSALQFFASCMLISPKDE
mmetsp:Transcript_33789/g.56490  ORF Transcript_33789/g.56490 Transcript_33789/m.56490 type:complete len:263 (-) Transcript_33789:485-1273(-)